MSFSLKLFGGVALADERGPLTGAAVQRHRLALLALLANARPRAVSRDKLIAWLWPERDAERARGLLNQAVYALRRALGAEAVLSSGDELQLNPAVVETDVLAFEAALGEGESERAVALYAGPFLDGFFLEDAPEFERWAERERERLAGVCARALEGLAESAEQSGNRGRAVEWWQARAAHDPYDSRTALRLVRALEEAGNRGGALQHAMAHLQFLREELGIEPGPEVLAAVERLRSPAVTAASAALEADQPATPQPSPDGPAITPVFPDSGHAPAPSRRRRIAWYGAAVLVVAAAIGGGIRLTSGKGETKLVAAPAVVDEIAQAVARELARRERGDTVRQLPQYRTRSIPAYELYLRGSDPALLRNDSTARQGLEYLRQAVALDSSYAAAWAGIARMTMRVGGGTVSSEAKARAQAEAAARKALTLDDSLADAHAILGVIRARALDFRSGEQHLRRAIALEPTRARHREWISGFFLVTGRPDEALAEAERALALEPLSPSATAEVARALAANNRCDEALNRLEAISHLDPPLLRVAPLAAHCYGRKGMWAKAIALLRPMGEREDPRILPLFGYMLGRAGEQEEARSIQARLTALWRNGAIGAVSLAYVPAALGDRDQAFAWLDRAVEDGSVVLFNAWDWGLIGPPFEDLRDDPRMDRLFARLGLQNR